jgi:hypothetical protein
MQCMKGFIGWCYMAKVKLTNDERGGAHILIFVLFVILFMVSVLLVSMQWMLQSANKTKSKLALDRAVHAASLSIDVMEAAQGRIVWDEWAGEENFDQYLNLNFLHREPPIVHLLEFVTNSTYPYTLERTVVINATKGLTRNVDVTIYGPSVVAIIEVQQLGWGKSESIMLSSVASVRFR